ncbi:pantoate--beta-alanine ligase [Betaproteobacteria bacterium GR16-43]|nr:pantoate--beta-alanine ligase [Betaproteobacteria bacterium GR16-43]
MDVITTVAALRERLRGEPSVALVPTMGNLHAGHLSLVEIARGRAGCVVATIFVNRLQFEPGGDFDRYPRTMERDRELLAKAGCHVLFAPDEREVYPEPQEIRVTPPKSAAQLCGDYRPGHFEGVVTVVSKLFNLVRPQVAVFGSKDYQQLHVIRTLERQLNFGIEIVAGTTVRDPDGLAMSSRNGYLSPQDRARAPGLNQVLRQVKQGIEAGDRNYASLLRVARDTLDAAGWRVDYVELRGRATLEAPTANERELVVLGAAWLGKTRLIDNLEIN